MKPMNRTVLATIDFSKAYDKVWRDGLLWKMQKKGLPKTLIRWTQGWLSNRQAFVTFGDSKSEKTLLRQGVPQGSVIAPLLFLVYIDDLAEVTPDDVTASLFADDVAVSASRTSLRQAESAVQRAVNKIAEWSLTWKLTISLGKCESSFFTTNTKEARWIPTITIGDTTIKTVQNPLFLGLHYDRQMTFTAHTEHVTKKVQKRSRVLLHLAGTDWGHSKRLIRDTYTATSRSLVEYAGAAWHPWMSSTNLERLEAAQRFAGRAVTGQLKTTPNEAVLLDAGLPTIKERCKFIAINALEKSMRLDPSNPRRQIAEKPQHRRTKKTDWRDHARDKWNEIFTEGCNPEPCPDPVAPWTKLSNCAFTYTNVEKRQDDETKKKAGEEAINLNHDTYKLNIYTDGLAQDSNKNGGAGVVIVPSDPEEETTMLSHPAGKLTSSFQAELTAINHALKHVASNDHHDCQIRIITDSKSALQRCESITSDPRPNSWLEREVLDSLMTLGERQVGIVFLWCPSHCGLWGNEEADRCAAEGSAMSQDNIPWTYHSAQAKIRRNKEHQCGTPKMQESVL